MDVLWEGLIGPLIEDCDFTHVVELAAGHGRNSEKLRHLAGRLYLVDINRENVDFLERRFAGAANSVFVHNDGISLERSRTASRPSSIASMRWCISTATLSART